MNSRNSPTWHPSVRTDFIRLGSVTTNRKNGLTGEQLTVGRGSRSVSIGPSRMFSVLTEWCHVGYSREFVGTVCCTYEQSNTTIVKAKQRDAEHVTLPVVSRMLPYSDQGFRQSLIIHRCCRLNVDVLFELCGFALWFPCKKMLIHSVQRPLYTTTLISMLSELRHIVHQHRTI